MKSFPLKVRSNFLILHLITDVYINWWFDFVIGLNPLTACYLAQNLADIAKNSLLLLDCFFIVAQIAAINYIRLDST